MNKSASIDTHPKYDFLFLGLGAANCLLVLRLHDYGLLTDRSIAVIEPSSKSTNDRTFCFWATETEVSHLKLDSLVSHQWENIEIGGISKQHIAPLKYHHLRGIDLYNKTKQVLKNLNVNYTRSFVYDDQVVKSNHFEIRVENNTMHADCVFDNRPPSFSVPKSNDSHLLQSFYGWKIKSKTNAFDPSSMVMMDFNVPQANFTQFIYTLPFDEQTALIELTRFGTEKLAKHDAETILTEYIEKLNLTYDIVEIECAAIPMSSLKIEAKYFGENWVNMGSRANLMKPSTGYAFKSMAEDALIQAEAIKNNEIAKRVSRKSRLVFYDRLLLKILDKKPEKGKLIFETLFSKVKTKRVLNFLQERTTIAQELAIFYQLPKKLFLATAVNDLRHNIPSLPVVLLPFLFTIIAVLFSFSGIDYISWGILGFGFLSIGLSHGAIDHLTSSKIKTKKQLLYFAIEYLIKGAILGIVWLFLPDIALLLFIAYSAWHFGQADFKEWELKQGWQPLLWGSVVLSTILMFHFQELIWILQQIPELETVYLLQKISSTQLFAIQILTVTAGIILASVNKSKTLLLTLIYLILTSALPLLLAFGIYFVGQHSLHGWRHLLVGLNEKSSSLWVKSLPFSLGGALLILAIPFLAGPNYVGIFFVILSCLSIPHVFSMHSFYSRLK